MSDSWSYSKTIEILFPAIEKLLQTLTSPKTVRRGNFVLNVTSEYEKTRTASFL